MEALSLNQQAMRLVVVLGVALLIGLERERDQAERDEGPQRLFGGVRTFPLIALAGYLLSIHIWAYVAGLIALGGLLALSYHRKAAHGRVGLTSEVAALITYALGPTAQMNALWLTVASGIITVLLLELKQPLDRIARRLPDEEIFTFTQFALLTAVILPLLPNRSFTAFQLNPFKAWLIVIAVAGISYLSYLLQRWRGHTQGLLMAAVLGGIYSSTATTVALSRQGRGVSAQAGRLAGAIVIATGMMYIRLVVLVILFAPTLGYALLFPFAAMSLLALLLGVLWSQRGERGEYLDLIAGNPLQLSYALMFAVLFVGLQVITQLTLQQLGNAGLYTLAFVSGTTAIDPFVLGITQHTGMAARQAAIAVGIAAASNNLFKGIYAWRLGGAHLGRRVLLTLILLGALTIPAVALLSDISLSLLRL